MTVGASPARREAVAKVTGAIEYPADRFRAGDLVGIVVFTDQPHARLLSVDFAAARAVPGVVAVLGGDDVPVNDYGLTKADQPVFVTPGPDTSEVPTDVSRWEADHLALVIAETLEAAHEGVAAITAEWEPLPVIGDIDAALAPGAPILHPQVSPDTNEYETLGLNRGDVAGAWAQAAAIVEATYDVPYQEHAYLQPEAALAYLDDDDRITIEVAGQWTHEDQLQIARSLDVDIDRVRVIYPAIGGAFGGREDISLQIVAALAVFRLAEQGDRRRVTIQWNRAESIVGHHKRHRARISARWGADASGRIVAIEGDCVFDAGAYNYTSNKVLHNAHLAQIGPYDVANISVRSSVVYTNAVPGGAFRGFGGPQGSFVAECQVNKLAEALGIDAVEIRRINMLREGSLAPTQRTMPAGVTLPEVLDACAEAAGWTDTIRDAPPFSPFATVAAAPDRVRRGRGIACSLKNVGFSFGFPERCEAKIVLHGNDSDAAPTSADLYHAGADVGQGAHTVFVQMAADAIGLDPGVVRGHFSDTASSGDSGSASASRMTFMAGNSILGAAEEAEKAWREGERPAVGAFRYVPPPTDELEPDTGIGNPHISYGYVAQAVEISVDTGTGHIRVDRVISAHDVGRAINPGLVIGQIEGGVAQAHGYTLTERLQVIDGRIANPRLSQYLIPGIGDMPTEIDSVVLELADPQGPWGARGMAEMPMMAYAPAVIAALHDATGVWFDGFPLTPDRVVAALDGAQG